MTLIVFESGLRTHTPWYDIFPPKNIDQLRKNNRSHTLSAKDSQREHDIYIEENYHQHPEQEQDSEQAQQLQRQAILARQHAHDYQQMADDHSLRTPIHLARDIMQKPVLSLDATATIARARQLFTEHRFRHLPVVQDKRLMGMLSDRDTLASIARGDANNTIIGKIMTTRVLTAQADTDIRLLARVMVDHRIGALPIIQADRREKQPDQVILQGMVTRSDILRAVMNFAPLELWG